MTIDEKLAVFREKYPSSNDEQVELYRQALLAEQAKPVVEVVDTPMPLITVAPVTAKPPATDLREELKQILLGTYGLSLRLSPAVQHRIRTEDLTENELLELVFQHT